MERVHASRLSRINSWLLIAIILVNAYVILAPFVPAAIFNFEKHATSRLNQLNLKIHSPSTSTIPSDNRLVVPAMLLDQPIFDGPTLATANKGIWRRPNTSTPDQAGNTVLVGHRFTYTNPRGIFYQLDKIKVGDEVGVFWNHKKYLYTVSETEVVPPTQTDLETPSKTAELTLYTCTPLWSPKNRLVVIAKLESS